MRADNWCLKSRKAQTKVSLNSLLGDYSTITSSWVLKLSSASGMLSRYPTEILMLAMESWTSVDKISISRQNSVRESVQI